MEKPLPIFRDRRRAFLKALPLRRALVPSTEQEMGEPREQGVEKHSRAGEKGEGGERSSLSPTRRRISAPGRPRSLSGREMFCSTVAHGMSVGSWKTKPTV